MALTTVNDLIKGINFSILATANGSQHDQLVELAVPTTGTNGDGVGFILATHDTALDTPYVPDAATNTKWKTYLWARYPWANGTPLIYAWIDGAADDPTLKKWTLVLDIGAINTSLATLTATVAAFNAAIAAANTNSTSALNTANTAQTDVANLSNSVGALGQQRNPNDVLVPGTALQQIRTNAAGNGSEWFTPTAFDAIIAEERYAAGNNAPNFGAAGTNLRILNTTVSYVPTWALLDNANKAIKITATGFYLINGWATGNGAGHRTILDKSPDGLTLTNALSYFSAKHIVGNAIDAGANNTVSRFSNVVQVTVAPTWFHLMTYANGAAYYGKAMATGGTEDEVYSGLEVIKLS